MNEELQHHFAILTAALDELSTMGHEKWKTPGHPMNTWVSRDRVNRLAETATVSLEAIKQEFK